MCACVCVCVDTLDGAVEVGNVNMLLLPGHRPIPQSVHTCMYVCIYILLSICI